MAQFTYQTRGVCSRSIDISVEDGIIREVVYHGGCSGNTQAVAALVVGMDAEEAIGRLRGIRCGGKSTSCPDQLASAIEACLALSSDEESDA
jgi:uncharacterized protein (TIGR03905 family)